MMMKMTGKTLATAFYWFGLVMGTFGFFTEISEQQLYLSSAFYLTMSIVAFLAAISVATIHKME